MEPLSVPLKAAKLAEIVPPLEDHWYITSPPTNVGWIKVILPGKNNLVYPLRPGATMSLDPAYVGDIVLGLGWPGTVTPASGDVIFYNNNEQEQVNDLLYGKDNSEDEQNPSS